MNQYKAIKPVGTFIVGDESILPARVLPVGTVFAATAQAPVMMATGKPPRDDRRQAQGKVIAYKVMLGTKFNGQPEYAYTVRNGVRYAVPYTPPAAAKAAEKPEAKEDVIADILKRLAVLEVHAFDKDGDGIVDEDEAMEGEE